MSTTFYNTFSITISYSKNFGAYLCTGKPNQFPMAPPARSDSGLRPPQGQSRHWKPIWFSSYITYSKGAKILAYLKTNGYRKNRMRSQRRLWPCVGRRPESDPAGGVFGNTFGSLTYSVFKYKHQNFYLVQTSFSEFVQ